MNYFHPLDQLNRSFHDDDVIHTKIMAILSTCTSGIFNIFHRNLQKKETAVILKRIDQLPQNLARLHNLVGSFDRSHKNFNFFYSSYCFHCFVLFVYCPPFVPSTLSAFCSKKNIKLLKCEQIIYHFKARDLEIPNIYIFFRENLNFAISMLK